MSREAFKGKRERHLLTNDTASKKDTRQKEKNGGGDKQINRSVFHSSKGERSFLAKLHVNLVMVVICSRGKKKKML